MNLLARHFKIEAIGQIDQLVFVQFLLRVRDVLAFARFAEAVTFDGLEEDDGGLVFRLHGDFESVVDLDGIVTAAAQVAEFFVGLIFDEFEQFGYLPKNS